MSITTTTSGYDTTYSISIDDTEYHSIPSADRNEGHVVGGGCEALIDVANNHDQQARVRLFATAPGDYGREYEHELDLPAGASHRFLIDSNLGYTEYRLQFWFKTAPSTGDVDVTFSPIAVSHTPTSIDTEAELSL